MFVPALFLLSIGMALLRGGQLKNLLTLNIRHYELFFVPLLLQIIAFTPFGDMQVDSVLVAPVLYALSMGFAALALWFNRHLPGAIWIVLGLFLNFLVISLNGGFMPGSAAAREIAGMPPLSGRTMNIIPLSDTTILPFLGDILPLPKGIPFANVFSIGDILITVGGIIFTQVALVTPKAQSAGAQKG